MKRFASIVAILFFISFDNTAEAQVVDTIAIDTLSAKICVKEMTCRSFIKEIYDYRRKSTPWQYKGKRPALLAFYANWCSPCRHMQPVVNKLANEYKGRIKFYRINVDNEKDLAQYFKTAYIPLFVFIPLHETPTRHTGAMSEDVFRGYLEELLQ